MFANLRLFPGHAAQNQTVSEEEFFTNLPLKKVFPDKQNHRIRD